MSEDGTRGKGTHISELPGAFQVENPGGLPDDRAWLVPGISCGNVEQGVEVYVELGPTSADIARRHSGWRPGAALGWGVLLSREELLRALGGSAP